MNLRSVDVAGTSVQVRTWGPLDGVPFVFWHSLGLAGNGSFLDVAAPALVEAGFTPVALDAPGYGGSAALGQDGYAIVGLADLVWSLAEALGLARPLVVSGHSWGGTIAITAAARRPDDVAALVLYDSGHRDYADLPDARPEASVDELIAELEAEPLPATWDELVALLAEHGLDQEWTLSAWREGFEVAPDGAIRIRASNEVLALSRIGLMQARASTAWPAVAAARIPTLVLLATEPEQEREPNVRDGKRMQEAVPTAEIRQVAGMRHAVFADLGERAGSIVAEWLGALQHPA